MLGYENGNAQSANNAAGLGGWWVGVGWVLVGVVGMGARSNCMLGGRTRNIRPSSSPQWVREKSLLASFISQLSKHDSFRPHGCYWFLI